MPTFGIGGGGVIFFLLTLACLMPGLCCCAAPAAALAGIAAVRVRRVADGQVATRTPPTTPACACACCCAPAAPTIQGLAYAAVLWALIAFSDFRSSGTSFTALDIIALLAALGGAGLASVAARRLGTMPGLGTSRENPCCPAHASDHDEVGLTSGIDVGVGNGGSSGDWGGGHTTTLVHVVVPAAAPVASAPMHEDDVDYERIFVNSQTGASAHGSLNSIVNNSAP